MLKTIKSIDLGKFLVEQCQQVDINEFVAKSKQKLKKEFIQTSLQIDGYDVSLTVSQLAHGGFRYWFNCPQCLQRVGKLYKHPLNQAIACRKCHRLEYRCRKYKGMVENQGKKPII